MAAFVATALLTAIVAIVAPATTLAFPVLNIEKGETLPTLQQLQPESDWITLSMLPAIIQVRNVATDRLF